MQPGLRLGQVVVSKAGRDEGEVFVVLGWESGGFVLVADGVRRKVEKPKRKNVRHLRVTPRIIWELEGKLSKGIRLNNAELRRRLQEAGQEGG
ncbi:MAG: KOW domain-containing RNA-binding protein [Firmicutes bacterium]|nr:KOW domain-containing RNA-binding protein [Bacillota bacterium]MCL5038965.1 KOW domain-containing RNA-binding protein [Bacillota bacterium]